jgi:hypothetical protein
VYVFSVRYNGKDFEKLGDSEVYKTANSAVT